MKFLYLGIDVITIIFPLLFSFHPKINFYLFWPALFKAILLASVPFIILDAAFTYWNIWRFNPRYITGLAILNLPLEEILFFICIPFSCIFTFYCLDKFFNLTWNAKLENLFCILFSGFLLFTGLINIHKIYTSVTFISTGLLCLGLKYKLQIKWFGEAVSVFVILLIPFFLVNGILTGTGLEQPVVLYNNAENMGLRVMTIPVEDFIYGFGLFLLNLSLFQHFYSKLLSREHY